MNLPIHPFPARMAPELALDALSATNHPIKVLDPMSGSGTALHHASVLGHEAHGRDMDPLAVLMAKVWTTPIRSREIEEAYHAAIKIAVAVDPDSLRLPWIDDDIETKKFVEFWFGAKQRKQLRCLSAVLTNPIEFLPETVTDNSVDVLKIAMTRIIITKEQCASLARDTSHSRPHKVVGESDYDVFNGFKKSVDQVARRLSDLGLKGYVNVALGDARKLDFGEAKFDLILTSPPYLNAIDYIRGHKLGLVWLGHSIHELREIRSTSIGTEKGPENGDKGADRVRQAFGGISALPGRYQAMIERYALDLTKAVAEAARVLKKNGRAIYVVGNSCLKGVFISNSSAVSAAATLAGLKVIDEVERDLRERQRYLPINTMGSLAQRMRTETILTFGKD